VIVKNRECLTNIVHIALDGAIKRSKAGLVDSSGEIAVSLDSRC
jgi:hypothetical protein